ncbi:phycobilisome protein [Synechococcales cyanobacterium C]|uniref:Phycobilisome protein n=1 Tax=Petrachloros mirabilis ULC683 TaxID=2781853 RepID=A0A8K1ZXV0_9CYAN|nr:phycobilisome protein [Petrachloros mirabilis]NCJ06091.1 phycobilisome protein [Petrachloros mirabilis ULC683]
MTQLPLSEKARTLIPKARIVSFVTWQDTHPPELLQRFQAADDEGRYLSDADGEAIQALAAETGTWLPVVKQLRDRAPDIVAKARAQVLAQFPNITEPGGGLYPPERADACWRDFWHFLRCITYGIAGQHTDYTSPAGLQAMEELYQELQVPLEAMVMGLEAIKTASLEEMEAQSQSALSPYFDHLIAQLRQFRAP